VQNKIKSNSELVRDFMDKKIVSFLNPYSYLELRESFNAYNEVDAWGLDGLLMVCMVNFSKNTKHKRSSFDNTSIANEVLSLINLNKSKLYVVGSSSQDVENFARYINDNYKSIILVGSRSGYFNNEDEVIKCHEDIKINGADYVICGMGTPSQERFLLDLRGRGWAGGGITCGGFIKQTAKKGRDYYPKIFDRWNMRFLYRIIDEPILIKRYLIKYPISVVLFLYDLKFRSAS
jgi:N-acetylglucosaminyldiphosphoundecaprenol N-acetyl-beta-D-mannosaminyltransferase